MPKVSVVIASYQHARFVRQAIESVLDQSFQDFEIVVTDDGSRDGTPDVIRSIGDRRVKLEVFPRNKGACSAMNASIARSTGTYVAVLNSDDYWLPGKLARQVAFLDAQPELAAAFARPVIVDERGAELPDHLLNRIFARHAETRQGWLRTFFREGNCLCHPTLLIRRACYDEIGGYDPRLAQLPDLDMWVRLASRHAFAVLPDVVTAFRLLDDQSNASALRPDVQACLVWEYEKVLARYRALDDGDFRAVFADEIAALQLAGAPQDVALARIAIANRHPWHQRFGLELLYEAAGRGSPGVEAGEIPALAKTIDPYCMRVRARLERSQSKARGIGSLRRFMARKLRPWRYGRRRRKETAQEAAAAPDSAPPPLANGASDGT